MPDDKTPRDEKDLPERPHEEEGSSCAQTLGLAGGTAGANRGGGVGGANPEGGHGGANVAGGEGGANLAGGTGGANPEAGDYGECIPGLKKTPAGTDTTDETTNRAAA